MHHRIEGRTYTTYAVFGLIVLATVAITHGCGITTHNVIAHRALKMFQHPDLAIYKEIIEQNQDAFQNGAAFPDFGYDCFLASLYPQLPNMSECAHWPPFQNATVQYLRNRFGGSSSGGLPTGPAAEAAFANISPDDAKLLAFLFGVVSHSTADVIWHDLDAVANLTQQGFIQALYVSNYNGRFGRYDSTAHSEADQGGEFMSAYETDLSFLVDEWYLPSSDLQVIFESIGFPSLPTLAFDACNAELYAAVMAVKDLVGKFLYPYFAEKSPFLVDEFQEYWVGGVNNMAVWTTQCWPKVIGWLAPSGANYSDVCLVLSQSHWSLDGLAHTNASAVAQQPWYAAEVTNLTRLHSLPNYRPFAYSPVVKQRIREIINSELTTTPSGRGTVFSRHTSDAAADIAATPRWPGSLIAETPQQLYSDGWDKCSVVPSSADGSVAFYVNQPFSGLGTSVVAGDLNLDGIDDLVIGAPGYPRNNVPQTGAVFIVFGKQGIKGPVSFNLSTNLNDTTSSALPGSVMALQGEGIGDMFGASVAIVDLNLDGLPDLVVAAPPKGSPELKNHGRVYVYYGHRTSPSTLVTLLSTPNITFISGHDWTNLGSVLRVADVDDDGHDDIIIGCPYARHSGPPVYNKNYTYSVFGYQAGSVSVYLSSASKWDRLAAAHAGHAVVDYRDSADWHAQGDELYSCFGADFAVVYVTLSEHDVRRVILVSAPEYWNAVTNYSAVGMLYGYDITNGLGNLSDPLSLLFTISGVAMFDKLGFSIASGQPFGADGGNYMLLTLPTRETSWFVEKYPQAGYAALLELNGLKGTWAIDELSLITPTTFAGGEEFARFGWKAIMQDVDGDGVDDLLIAEPHRNAPAGGVDSGAVYGFRGGSTDFPKGNIDNPLSSSTWCFQGAVPLALYGRAVAVLDFNGDGKMDLAMGGPRDSSYAEDAGGIVVLLDAFN